MPILHTHTHTTPHTHTHTHTAAYYSGRQRLLPYHGAVLSICRAADTLTYPRGGPSGTGTDLPEEGGGNSGR